MERTNAAQQDAQWADLMIRVQSGDKLALEDLFREISPVLLSFFRGKAPYLGLPEEALQATLITIFKNRHVYLPRRSFRAWMFAIARTKFIDEVRKLPSNYWVLGEEQDKSVTSEQHHTYSTIEGNRISKDEIHSDAASRFHSGDEEMQRLHESIAKLPVKYREALTLTKLQGMSVATAAKQLGISESSLKVRTHRALKKLGETIME